MGTSTNGIVCFGIDFGEKHPLDRRDEDDYEEDFDDYDALEELICREAGLPEYGTDHPDDYYELKWAAEAAYPVDVVTYCSIDYPMYALALRGTEITARRGYAVELDMDKMAVSDEDIERFRKWCETHDVEYTEPKWLLVSYWA